MVATSGAPPQVVVLVSTSKSGKQMCIMNLAADVVTAVNGRTAAGTYYARKAGTVSPPSTSVTVSQCGGTYQTTPAAGWQ